MENMRKSTLVNMDFTGAGAVTQGDSKLNNPIAKEHMPHVTTDNPQKEYITGKTSYGRLGGKGHSSEG